MVLQLFSGILLSLPAQEVFTPTNPETSKSYSEQPHIAIISALTFIQALYLQGSTNFYLSLCSTTPIARLAQPLDNPADLSTILSEYHKFVNVFSKAKAKVLALYCLYNLQINLEEGAWLLVNTIYNLSFTKQETLKEFINENLNTGIFWPTSCLHRASILFVKKKEKSLCFYVNFYSLNCITKKDWYLLPFISNLLNFSHKACIYTKIDLCHIYYLVHIAEDKKWKTTFYTHYRSFEWSIMLFGLTNASAAF